MPINDSAAVKAPPRKTGQRSTPVRSAPAPLADTRSLNERRRDGLIALSGMAQGLCLMTQQYADAATIGQHFPPIAVELANIADDNDVIAKPIDFLIAVGPYGALITACIPFALQIMANHRIIDGNRMIGQGVTPPEVLEAQMKAQIAGMQAEAMRAQQAALAEAEAAQRAFEEIVAKRHEAMNNKVAA